MRDYISRLLLVLMVLLGAFVAQPAVAQHKAKGKLSANTRLIIADRDGKISLDKAKTHMAEMKKQRRAARQQTHTSTWQAESVVVDDSEGDLPTSMPFTRGGRKYVQCWIGLTDNSTSQLETLGVQVTARFDKKVTANVPVAVLERVAALDNVTRVSVAKMLKRNTYRSRVLTNVDDILNLTSDAQNAGLTQAYDGTGVVLGIVDTGIDFGHAMFKDASGNSRIKKAYVYDEDADAVVEYTGSSAYYTDETHGTHTSSIAGGSDYTATAYVYTTGTSYTTVSNAKFGGMAPGTDLVLCDLGETLTDANIAAGIQYVKEYANSVGKPYVVSLSLGGHFGPHDGTGDMADLCKTVADDGGIILFASSNDGQENLWLGKNASASSPSQSVLTSSYRSSYSVDLGEVLTYARTPNTELAVRYHVVNTSTNKVLWTSNEITTDDYFVDDDGNIEMYGAEISVNDTGSDGSTKLSTYFTAYNSDSDSYGYLCGYMDQDPNNNKWYLETILYYLKPVSTNYKIAMSVYPRTGTSYVDSWPFSVTFTASSATYSSTTFVAGGNDCSVSDEATYPDIISVGSYCSSKYWYGGTTSGSRYNWTNDGVYGQISGFSSYQAEGYGPLGTKLPWITAPGEVIIAGYNSGYSTSNYYYAYGTNKVLGAMSGTSMATPCAAGIVALWKQVNPSLNVSQVKTVMKETAQTDTYTSGTYASHFGQGKIDALAGIQYILENYSGPTITASPKILAFTGYTSKSYEQTFRVSGTSLESDIQLTLTDESGSFELSQNSISQTQAEGGVDITVTYTPTTVGNHTATITLTSAEADDVVVNLTGSAQDGTVRYTVTFDPGTGRVSPASWTQQELEEATTLPTAQSPDSDYDFLGWATAAVNETTAQPTVLAAGTSYQPTANVTLYAVYSQTITTGSGDYELVTSTPSDWSGQYLIVYTSGNLALKGSLTANSSSNTLSVTISNNTIASTSTTDAESFTIEAYGSGYSILGASGRYIYGGNNTISYATSAYANTITLSGSDATITYGSYNLKYYKGTMNKCFRYTSSTSKTYAVQLYKKQPGTETTYTSFPTAPTIGTIANLIDQILKGSSTLGVDNVRTKIDNLLWK